MMELKEILEEITNIYMYFDKEMVELGLATVLSSKFDVKLPTWLLIVGVPGSGKTTMSRWLRELMKDKEKIVHKLDDYTTASVQDWMEDADEHCVMIPDLVKFLESDDDAFAMLRLAYEGELVRRTARDDRSTDIADSRFSLLGLTTHHIDSFFKPEAKLGAIMLKYRLKKLTEKQEDEINKCRPPNIKDDETITRLLQEFVDGLDYLKVQTIKNPFRAELGNIARAVEEMRTLLVKEQKFGKDGEVITIIPEASQNTRLTSQADMLSRYLAWIRGKDEVSWREIQTVAKAMVGCIPRIRYSIIYAIFKDQGIWLIIGKDYTPFGLKIKITGKDLRYYLRELEQLGIVAKQRPNKTTVGFVLSDKIQKAIELIEATSPDISESIIDYEWSPQDEEDYQAMIENWRDTIPPEDIDDELDDKHKEMVGDDT